MSVKDEFNKSLGASVALRRKAAGLTQAALADAMNISRASIANIEVGRQAMSAFQKHKIDMLMDDPTTALKFKRETLKAKLATVEKQIADEVTKP